MNTIKVLVIGLTLNHTEHIVALKSFSFVRIIGICSTNHEMARKVALEFNNPPRYTDYKSAIEILKPDAVFISLPHYKHMEVIEFALKNNIHIFKEKPFAYDLDEAKRLEMLFKNSKYKIMIVSQRRFHYSYEEAKKFLNYVGQIRYVSSSYCFNKSTSGWRMKEKESGGGVIIDSGYHFIDLLFYYFGLPEKVSCKTSKLSNDQSCETEDYAFIEFLYPDHKIIQLILNRLSETKKEEIIIFGDLGKLIISKNEMTLELFDSGIIKKLISSTDGFNKAYLNQHKLFFSSLSNEQIAEPSISEGLSNSIIIEACYLSAKNNSNFINTKDLITTKEITYE